MTIRVVELTEGDSDTNATSYTTASFTVPGQELTLAIIVNEVTTPNTPVLTGPSGVSWTQVITAQNTPLNRRITMFRTANSSGDSTGTVDIAFSSQSQLGAFWWFGSFEKAAAGGTNGADGIVQSASNATAVAGTSLAVTLSAFADTTHNVPLGAILHQENEVTTPDTGYVELADRAHAAPIGGFQVQASVGQDTSVSWSWATNANAVALAVELQALIHPARMMMGVGR